jgi:hypothetical protein
MSTKPEVGVAVKDIPKETILDKDLLYLRVHKANFQREVLNLKVAFANHGAGMSTDWSKHSTPQKTKDSVTHYGKDPKNYGVLQMNVAKVKNIKGQIVEHTPRSYNLAHTDVKGEKTQEALVLFSRIYDWCIKPPKSP